MSRFALALVATLVLVSNLAAVERRTPVTEAVAKTKASIVTIRFGKSIGSGVIVDDRGLIVTNAHVVGKNEKVNVTLCDGTSLDADVLVADPSRDLAVVRIKTDKKLQALALAQVDDLMVGEDVIAIGHPYGYNYTVSVGIVGATNREVAMPTGHTLEGLIQVTAAINPGNSGGALLNINGELIGINTAVRDGAQGIAFAINADSVRGFLGRHISAVVVGGVEISLTRTAVAGR
jgi:serine protease Do